MPTIGVGHQQGNTAHELPVDKATFSTDMLVIQVGRGAENGVSSLLSSVLVHSHAQKWVDRELRDSPRYAQRTDYA
ncbi:hypothetical protein CUROG_06055 [Corynebacterium urogenitale]|uniref:Uncharacterized protein n=1 Tax=Corynebacterium urogenitale TaxID=2487892 RepID=A0A5J6Z6H6_9CORY|nr:hypothetical protein CUROG_06055 [Corynebacterium urogenitale]